MSVTHRFRTRPSQRRAAVCLGALVAAAAFGTPSASALTKVADPVSVSPDHPTLDQFYGDVAMAADGSLAVVYSEQDPTVGSDSERVFVQRFSASLAPVGTRTQIGPNDRRVTLPSIAMAPDGRFAVAFQTYDPDTHLHVQRFAASGAAAGGVIDLETAGRDNDSYQPAIAMADDGRFAVAWIGPSFELRVRSYAADGTPLTVVQPLDVGKVYQQAPSIGMAPDGHFIVSGTRRDTPVGEPLTQPGWRFHADGTPDGGVFTLFSGDVNVNAGATSIGMAADGTAFTAWGMRHSADPGGYEHDVWGRSIPATGTPTATPFIANDNTTYVQANPDVERPATGDMLIAYEGFNGGAQVGYVRVFQADGTPIGIGAGLSVTPPGYLQTPHVDSDGAGRLAYEYNGRDAKDASRARVYVGRWNYLDSVPSPTPTPTPTPTPAASPDPTPAPAPAPAPPQTPQAGTTLLPTPAPPAIAAPVPAQAACTTGKLILTDVFPLAGKTRLLGVAGPQSAGQKVSIVSTWNGKTVATLTVAADGSFAGTAPLPPAAIRTTNAARYQAIVGGHKSQQLKFARRMYTTGITASGRSLTFTGAAVKPLATKPTPIVVRASASCSTIAKGAIVATVQPSASGTFSATFPLPAGLAAGTSVYLRAETQVRKTVKGKTTFPTYTLTRGIKLGA
ncbi:MAG: hypothetical protein REI11_21810 [Patulibacter sp.]|nr:hypothetical protein [Patulibacter sp.]